MKRNRLWSLAVAAVAIPAGLLSCQAYEVDPVLPAAAKIQDNPQQVGHKLTPNIMLVVDRSGSMADNPDGSGDSACAGAAGQNGYSCKWDQLLGALCGDGNSPGFVSELITQGGTSDPIKIGLITFAGSGACDVGVVQEPISSSRATSICPDLLAIAPSGGTPTAASVQEASAQFDVDNVKEAGRANYIVLLTDGAPNCNSNFQATQANCDPNSTQLCVSPGACFGQGQSPLGCLDEDNLVSTVQAVQQGGVNTFVLGFGADFTNPALAANDTLNKTAIAGGEAIMNAQGQPATPAFYEATDSASLQAALNAIVALVNNSCTWTLESTPPSPQAVEVVVTLPGGSPQTLAANQYTVNGSTVTLTDQSLCDQLNGSSATNPAQIEFKYLGQ